MLLENRLIIINKKNSSEEECHQLAGISNMLMEDRTLTQAHPSTGMFKQVQVIGEEKNLIKELAC